MQIHMGNLCELMPLKREKGEPLKEQTLSMRIALICLFSCHMGVTCSPTKLCQRITTTCIYVSFLKLPISIMPILI